MRTGWCIGVGAFVVLLTCVAHATPATSAWTVDMHHDRQWKRMQHAVSPEAARLAEGERARADPDPLAHDDHFSATEETFNRVVGRFDDDEPSMIFEHAIDMMERQEWELLRHTLTDDVSLADHTLGVSVVGQDAVVRQMQAYVDAQKQRCAELQCASFSYTVEPMPARGPAAVFRVIDTVTTADGRQSRLMHVWMVILRPQGPQAPLANAKLAVIERITTTMRADYAPPTELFRQRAHIDEYVDAHTHHWQGLHRRALAEQEEAIVRNMQFGAANPRHWQDRARRYCQARKERGELAESFDCADAEAAFERQAALLHETTQAHRRARLHTQKTHASTV